MNYKLLFTATVCAAAFCATPVHADYTSWQNPNYDFSKISRIYVGRVDMSDVALSSARQKSLETTFASRMNKAKIPKDVMLTIEAPTASKSLSVSRVQKASAESGTEEADDLFGEECECTGIHPAQAHPLAGEKLHRAGACGVEICSGAGFLSGQGWELA